MNLYQNHDPITGIDDLLFTILHYDARCLDDLHTMLKKAGDWVELGGADEQKPAKEGTVEAWGGLGDHGRQRDSIRGKYGVQVAGNK